MLRRRNPRHFLFITGSLIQGRRSCDREAGGGYHQGAMHLGDGIFIFILALVLLGPKKTSELANQLGKLMGEFRKASNDFKYQFNEEMRTAEQQEQQRKQAAERAGLTAQPEQSGTENKILPPPSAEPTGAESLGAALVGAEVAGAEAVPYAVSAISATTGEEHAVDDHPLLRVDVIPPMDGSPADQTSSSMVTPVELEAERQAEAADEKQAMQHG